MLEYFSAPENNLFLIALGLMVALFIVQLLGMVLGMRVFGFLDSLLPDFEVDVPEPGSLQKVFGFFHLGRVPLIMTIDVFLFFFSGIGFNLQHFLESSFGFRLPLTLASGIAFVCSLPLTGMANKILSGILPKDETAALSQDTFIGRPAIITIGTVTHTRQSEARLKDALGRDQYVQVIADVEGETFPAGSEVLLVQRQKHLFTVIKNTQS
jgi:hypothetical protein